MVRRVKLSEKFLRDAEPAEGKSYQIFDTEILGLAARCRARARAPSRWTTASPGASGA
jgi:hypothetical protein